jgi:hypothetical protein
MKNETTKMATMTMDKVRERKLSRAEREGLNRIAGGCIKICVNVLRI